MAGADQLSAIERALIEGFVGAATVLESMNVQLTLGEKIDVGQHAQCISAMVRVANKLGVSRRSKPAQDLVEYLAAQNKNQEQITANVSDVITTDDDDDEVAR